MGAVLGCVASCAQDPASLPVTGVSEAQAEEVGACTLVTSIRSTPGIYGPLLAEEGLRQARNAVLKDAKDAGANTVVFDKVAPGAPVYEVTAGAYRC